MRYGVAQGIYQIGHSLRGSQVADCTYCGPACVLVRVIEHPHQRVEGLHRAEAAQFVSGGLSNDRVSVSGGSSKCVYGFVVAHGAERTDCEDTDLCDFVADCSVRQLLHRRSRRERFQGTSRSPAHRIIWV